MSVTFHTNQDPIGYCVRCAFSDTVRPTYDEALAVARCHPVGGCAESVAFVALRDGESNEQYWGRIDAFNGAHDFNVDDCAHPGAAPVYAERCEELDVCNANARFLLEALGFGSPTEEYGDDGSVLPGVYVELCGSTTPDDFLGRVLMALAVAPEDPGIPAQDVSSPGSARVVDFGRRAGYLQDRLANLLSIVTFAKERNLDICWG